MYSGVLFSAGIFGETSTEVCGLYVANGTGSSTITNDLAIMDSNEREVVTANMGYKEVDAGSYALASGADVVMVNGVAVTEAAGSDDGYSFVIAAGDFIQIITQTGTEAAYITVLKGK